MDISGIHFTYDRVHTLRDHALQRQMAPQPEDEKSPSSTEKSHEQNTGLSFVQNNEEERKEAEKQKNVEKLKERDNEVKAHEEAHRQAAGSLASAPEYKFKTGPDGKQYAVSGHVDIDMSKGRTPEETIQKAQQIRRAALAPKDPSAQDRKVAQKASQMESEARAEQAKEAQEDMEHILKSASPSSEPELTTATSKNDQLNTSKKFDIPHSDQSKETKEITPQKTKTITSEVTEKLASYAKLLKSPQNRTQLINTLA